MQILIICLEPDATMLAPAAWESFLRHTYIIFNDVIWPIKFQVSVFGEI